MEEKKKVKHSRYSPSKLEALEECPCFEYSQMVVKEGEETPAERGTRLHSLVETGDAEFVHDEGDKELFDEVEQFLIGQRMKHGLAGLEELTELKVELLDLTYGTADKVLIWKELKKAIVIDWKFIRNKSVSEPKDNLQIKIYAGGVLEMFPEIDEVEAYIVAPTLRWLPPSHIYTRADLPGIRDQVERITLACADPFKKPCPCELCNNCANASRCPALGTTAVVVANNIGLPMPATFAPDSLVIPEDRAKAYIIAKALENWSSQVKKNVNEWVREGNTLPGHSTVTRKGNMKVDDVEAAVAALRAKLTDSEILGAMSISITKVTEAVATKESKKTARDTVESLLTGLTSRGADVVYALRKKGDAI